MANSSYGWRISNETDIGVVRHLYQFNVPKFFSLSLFPIFFSVVLDAKPVGNGELAVTLFERLETGGSLWPRSQLWLLYRPPWGAQPLCCKRYVHTRISHIAQVCYAIEL